MAETKTLKKSDLVQLVIRGMSSSPENIGTWQEVAKTIVETYLNTDPTKKHWWAQQAEDHYKKGMKLAGVKAVKDATGIGLREAKHAYEYYEQYGSWNIDEKGQRIL